MVSVSSFCRADSRKVINPNSTTVNRFTENKLYNTIPKKAWNETAKYAGIGECGLTLSFTNNTILSAFMSVGHMDLACKAIRLISRMEIPPTKIPVNGELKACIKPPNPHSLSAHKAVKRSITNPLSLSFTLILLTTSKNNNFVK